MLTVDIEEQELLRADEHLARASKSILRQERIVQELERDGHSVELAYKLLLTLRDTYDVMLEHRACIVQSIERLRRQQRPS